MKLIDADRFADSIGGSDWIANNIRTAIKNFPTIEAIPKDQYEQRLKSDMVAMLTDLLLEVEEYREEVFHRPNTDYEAYAAVDHCYDMVEEKINALKGGPT